MSTVTVQTLGSDNHLVEVDFTVKMMVLYLQVNICRKCSVVFTFLLP